MAEPGFRIGHGYDAHRFVSKERPLILGGIELDHPQSLRGHSDADVLTHAVIDAILGGMALGDLGRHFPSDDQQWRGADSLDLLTRTLDLAKAKGGHPVQLDCTVYLEAPRIAPHIESMRGKMAAVLGIGVDRISIKATTTDGMGFVGRGEGAAASAVVMLALD